ncbi:MAG: hypothetical protein MdMp014T_0522 [Treponematales bacterium]
MKRVFLLVLCFSGAVFSASAQNTSTTNNNTITINGNVYYFKPSTTPSSPQPKQSADFISTGDWYGADAAKAWASVVDWVLDHATDVTRPVTESLEYKYNGYTKVFISAIHAYHGSDKDTSDYRRYSDNMYASLNGTKHEIRIDYWLVKPGGRMEDGQRFSRWFRF